MPAKSKKQQRYMGMLYHCKETGDCPDKKTKRKAKKIKKKIVRDFARTKHEGLPERIRKKKKRKSKNKKSNFMISRLIKLANELDTRGLTIEADLVDDLLKYADEDKRTAIKVAAKEILKPGFVVMGHGTSADRAKSIVQNGFTLRGHPISTTFLLMTDSSSLKKDWYDTGGPQAEDQLAWWPYGEASMGSIGVAIMRLPESIFSQVGIGKEGTKMFSADPEKEDDRERGLMADPIGIGDEYKRKIPNYFFFASWNQEDAELTLNPNYDESKILEHLSIDESEVALPEEEHAIVTILPEDSDFEVW